MEGINVFLGINRFNIGVLLFTTFRDLIFILFLNETAKKKTFRRLDKAIGTFVLILFNINTFLFGFNTLLVNILCFGSYIVYSRMYYSNYIEEDVILVIIYTILFNFINYLVNILGSYLDSASLAIEYIVTFISLFTIYIFVVKFCGRFIGYKKHSLSHGEFWLLISFGLPGVLFIIFYVDVLSYLIGMICAVAIIMLNYEFRIIRDSEENMKSLMERNELLEERDKLMRQVEDDKYKSFLRSKEAEETLGNINHDLNHHFNYLLSCEGLPQAAKDYIYGLKGQVNEISKFFDTGNALTDIILEEYKAEAEKRGIIFSGAGGFDEDAPKLMVDPSKLSVILGNLLKNAIEAASKVKGDRVKKVSAFFVQNKEDGFYLRVENTMEAENIKVVDGEMETTKEDKRLHGIGLKSVRNAVSSCGGKIEIIPSPSKGLFVVEVNIPIK